MEEPGKLDVICLFLVLPQRKFFMILRYFYLDEIGLTSLHAQLNHREITEHSTSAEDGTSRKFGWTGALQTIFGVNGETASAIKETVSSKFRLRAENMLTEITASLRAQGILYKDLYKAADACRETQQPVWVSGKFSFHAAQFANSGGFESVNDAKAIIFSSMLAGDTYNESDDYFKHPGQVQLDIFMSASLYKFPGLRDGIMGTSSHEALFFRRLGGASFKYLVFGSFFAVGDGYQIKPYALSI